jgi:formate-dependent nitrite reductase membrane component NrfD
LLNTIASAAAVTYASSHLTQPPALLQANAAVHSYTTAFWWAAGIFLLAGVLTAGLLRSGVAQVEDAHESVPAV